MSEHAMSDIPNKNASGLDGGENTDVSDLHAAVLRERPDPVEGREPLSLWMVVFVAALLFWAGTYLTHYSGGFRADEFSERQINPLPPPSEAGPSSDDPAAKAAKEGLAVFLAQCSPCHQADGNGVSGQFPPLAGSEWVLAEGPNRIIRIVLNGLSGPIQVKGSDYNSVMNGFRDSMDDKQIANVLTYIRNSWGNKAGLVTPAEVSAIRASTKDRTEAWTAAALLQMPVSGGEAPSAGAPAPVQSPEALKEALKKLPPEELKALLQGLGN
jgi:mono/diheme cytochrome c family protein